MPIEMTLNPVVGYAGLVRVLGRVFSTSTKAREWVPIPHLAKWVLPWTLIIERAGVLHLTFDLSSYWFGHKATEYLKDSGTLDDLEKLGRQFVDKYLSDQAEVLAALIPGTQPDPNWVKLINEVRMGNAQLIVEVPPMWLADP